MFQQAAVRVTQSNPGIAENEAARVRDPRDTPLTTRNVELAADAMHAMAANGFGDVLV